jgi:hypothetical protein
MNEKIYESEHSWEDLKNYEEKYIELKEFYFKYISKWWVHEVEIRYWEGYYWTSSEWDWKKN